MPRSRAFPFPHLTRARPPSAAGFPCFPRHRLRHLRHAAHRPRGRRQNRCRGGSGPAGNHRAPWSSAAGFADLGPACGGAAPSCGIRHASSGNRPARDLAGSSRAAARCGHHRARDRNGSRMASRAAHARRGGNTARPCRGGCSARPVVQRPVQHPAIARRSIRNLRRRPGHPLPSPWRRQTLARSSSISLSNVSPAAASRRWRHSTSATIRCTTSSPPQHAVSPPRCSPAIRIHSVPVPVSRTMKSGPGPPDRPQRAGNCRFHEEIFFRRRIRACAGVARLLTPPWRRFP